MEGVQVAFVAAPLGPQILVHVLSKAFRETGIVCEVVDGCVDGSHRKSKAVTPSR